MHLSKLFPVTFYMYTTTNSIYLQLVKYVCKIFYSSTTLIARATLPEVTNWITGK